MLVNLNGQRADRGRGRCIFFVKMCPLSLLYYALQTFPLSRPRMNNIDKINIQRIEWRREASVVSTLMDLGKSTASLLCFEINGTGSASPCGVAIACRGRAHAKKRCLAVVKHPLDVPRRANSAKKVGLLGLAMVRIPVLPFTLFVLGFKVSIMLTEEIIYLVTKSVNNYF